MRTDRLWKSSKEAAEGLELWLHVVPAPVIVSAFDAASSKQLIYMERSWHWSYYTGEGWLHEPESCDDHIKYALEQRPVTTVFDEMELVRSGPSMI